MKFTFVVDSSIFLFWLIEKELVIFLHTPSAQLQQLSSWLALMIERCRLCPKHESLDQSNIPAAFTVLLPLSVVKQIWLATAKSHKLKVASIASAKCISAWYSGKNWVCRHLFWSCKLLYQCNDCVTIVWLHTHARPHITSGRETLQGINILFNLLFYWSIKTW